MHDEQPSGADRVGGLATPGAILTRMREVDADVRGLGHTIEAQRDTMEPAFVRAWRHWRDAWFRFYGENESFAARVFPHVLLEVEGFARRLPQWREAARRAGLTVTVPEPSRPTRPPVFVLPEVRLPNVPSLETLARPWLGSAAPMLAPDGPLSAAFWERVRPVAVAGAVVVGGLALTLVAANLRLAARQTENAKELLPLLMSARGMR